MKQCPNCHNEVPESARVCGYCGTRLANAGNKFCNNCGKEIPASAKVCGYCGTNQEKLAAAESVPVPLKETPSESAAAPAPAPKAGLPRRVIPAALAALLVVVAGVFFLSRPKSAIAPTAPVQSAAMTAAPAKPAPTKAALANTPAPAAQAMAPYDVGYSCQNETVPANTPIRVNYGWMASTAQQLADYFNAADHSILVDGKSTDILEQGLDASTTSKEGYPYRKIWMDIGSLQPGAHEIKTVVTITKKVTDGQDFYGPGTDNASWERVCTVLVKDIGAEAACNFAKFVSETIPDNSVLSPGQGFTKSWTLMNTGSCAWDGGYQLVFAGGEALGADSPVAIDQPVEPGAQVAVEVPFTAPSEPGVYTSNWKLVSKSGVKFFQVYVTIEVK